MTHGNAVSKRLQIFSLALLTATLSFASDARAEGARPTDPTTLPQQSGPIDSIPLPPPPGAPIQNPLLPPTGVQPNINPLSPSELADCLTILRSIIGEDYTPSSTAELIAFCSIVPDDAWWF